MRMQIYRILRIVRVHRVHTNTNTHLIHLHAHAWEQKRGLLAVAGRAYKLRRMQMLGDGAAADDDSIRTLGPFTFMFMKLIRAY